MKILNLTLWACIFCIGLMSFAQAQRTTEEFRLPEVPVLLTDPAERAAYLAVHYWDYFNFADTTLISRPEITEQAFVDFISILHHDTLFLPDKEGARRTAFGAGRADRHARL